MKKIIKYTIGLLVFTTMALFAKFNAQMINWKHGKVTSAGWHKTSLWIRVCLCLGAVLIFYGVWYHMILSFVIGLNLAFTGYDIIINLIMGNDWDYIGGTSKMDLFFRRHRTIYWSAKLLLLTVLILIILKGLL